jgi:hypothetical protein
LALPADLRAADLRACSMAKYGSGSVREGSLSSFEMTDPLFCCHSERMRGILLLFEIRAKLKLNHYPKYK